MGLLSTLLGRTKPVPANLDALFAMPSVAITLQSAAGMSTSGRAGVCYKPPSGQGFAEMQAEVTKLLAMQGGETLRTAEDDYGYHWVVIEHPEIDTLVTQVHLVNASLADAGWGAQLLCSVFGLAAVEAPDPGSNEAPSVVAASSAYLVYLFKRGTFYPFVPKGREHRDTTEELKLKSLVADDVTIEPELDRWFPLWDLPLG